MKALALLAALAATAAHADWLPDAVELPVATRHLAHNDRLNNKTPGVVLHFVTDDKRCKRQPDGLHVTSCAVVIGVRRAF
jgi:hypothetical protein